MTIPYCLRRARQIYGDQAAILHEDRRVTYREFASQVDRSARKLTGLGVAKGDRVAVLMLNGPAYLDLYYSIALTGAIIVPLNTRWHLNEMIFTLLDSGSRMLFVDDRFASLVPQLRASVPALEPIVFAGEGECPPGGTIDWRTAPEAVVESYPEPDEDDVTGLFYTSGTTGGPKGAMLTNRNVYSNAIHTMLPPALFSGRRTYLHAAPMFHLADAGAIHGLTLTGSTHCFITGFDPENLLRTIERYRITHLVLVPTMIGMLLNHSSFGSYDLSSVQRLAYGASPMPLPLLREAMQKLPHVEFSQGYGMTEGSALFTVLQWEDHRLENTDRAFAPVKSAGKPVMGVEIRVVDANDNDVPVETAGEIIARGPNIMKGYWNRPEITAEVLRGGWMHTGDMGAYDEEGFLYILDRKKDMIKTGSENVYSPEVESAMCGHPAVLEAAAIGVPDSQWGESVRAVVALRPGASLTAEELMEWCRGRLTHFKCPTSVVFTDTLPKGGTGKVQKNALRERFGGAAATAAD
jgi:long-chain acyl-CoA synthetase